MSLSIIPQLISLLAFVFINLFVCWFFFYYIIRKLKKYHKMESDWNVCSSDDEFKNCKGPWEPSIAEIEKIYSELDGKEVPDLNWKCPGYKSPVAEAQTVENESKNEPQPSSEDDKSDFDFLDEVTLPKLKIRKDGEDTLKGSAKKKTTSFDGVINNMRRHKLI